MAIGAASWTIWNPATGSTTISLPNNVAINSLYFSAPPLAISIYVNSALVAIVQGNNLPQTVPMPSGTTSATLQGLATSTTVYVYATSQALNPTTPPVVPTYLATGLSAATTYHQVTSPIGGLIASSGSTSVTFAGPAIFSDATYNLFVYDNTSNAVATITAKSTTGFTFTSTNAHVYSYFAAGS